MDKMTNCPHCGKPVELVDMTGCFGLGAYQVACKCGVSGPRVDDDQEDAIFLWNEMVKKCGAEDSHSGLADWDNAPDWAEWFAVDADGEKYWYQCEPVSVGPVGLWGSGEFFEQCGTVEDMTDINWTETLERRP